MAVKDEFLRRVTERLKILEDRLSDAKGLVASLEEERAQYAAARVVYEREMKRKRERVVPAEWFVPGPEPEWERSIPPLVMDAPRKGTREPGRKPRVTAMTIALELLEKKGGPMRTSDITKELVDAGKVKGQYAANTVGKLLSRDKRFYSTSRGVWDLASRYLGSPSQSFLNIDGQTRSPAAARRKQ